MLVRLIVTIGVVIATASTPGCGGAPVAPDPQPPSFALLPGAYHLTIVGIDEAGACDVSSPLGPSVGGVVNLAAAGQGWSARVPSGSPGTLEMFFERGPASRPNTTIAGTMQGTLTHFLDLSEPRRFVGVQGSQAGAPATFEAHPAGSGNSVLGEVRGRITFTAKDRSVVSCTRAGVLLLGV